MSKHYSPKRFFRQSPNRFLKQYFATRNAMAEVDFDTLKETEADPIYEAWLKLPENTRNEMERDF
jgi:hypothetical protein